MAHGHDQTVLSLSAFGSGHFYAVGAMFFKRALENGAGLARTYCVNNWTMGLFFLPLFLFEKKPIPWDQLHLPLIVALCFFAGHLLTFFAIRAPLMMRNLVLMMAHKQTRFADYSLNGKPRPHPSASRHPSEYTLPLFAFNLRSRKVGVASVPVSQAPDLQQGKSVICGMHGPPSRPRRHLVHYHKESGFQPRAADELFLYFSLPLATADGRRND